MSPNNLSDPLFSESKYLILTDTQYIDSLATSASIQKLEKILSVEFSEIPDAPTVDKYQKASLAKAKALQLAQGFNGVFFIYPDFLCADGTIKASALKIKQGWKAVMAPVPAVLDSILTDPELRKCLSNRSKSAVTELTPQKLVALSFKHFHPMMWGYSLDRPENHMENPVLIIREIDHHNLLIKAFHLHPIVIAVQPDNPYFLYKFDVSLDEEYVTQLFKSADDIYFPNHINEYAMVSTRSPGSPPMPSPGKFNSRSIHWWLEWGASKLHREIASKWFIWGNISIADKKPPGLEELLHETSKFVEQAIYRSNQPPQVLEVEAPDIYARREARKSRYYRFKDPQFGMFQPQNSMGRVKVIKTGLFPRIKRLFYSRFRKG